MTSGSPKLPPVPALLRTLAPRCKLYSKLAALRRGTGVIS